MNTKGKKRIFARTMYVMVIAALVFSVTGNAYAQDSAPRVGLVLNATGGNDFNWMAEQGLLRAATDLGISALVYQPADQSEYNALLQQCADANDLCIAVGFDYGVALANAARSNSDTMWGIVDYNYPDCWEGAEEGVECGSFNEISNVRGLRFNEKQAGYLAGVLAGRMTASNAVGAVGGMEIPPVVAFVEGYRNGAQCTNPAVNVLTTYTGTFSDPELGASTAQVMIEQGADVIFGAAGITGNGAILHSAQNGKWAIGVDTDQYLTVFGNGTVPGFNKLLSSAMKRVDNAVYQTIEDYVNGNFTYGTLVYDLAAEGVGLSPFHEAESSIPQEVKDHLDVVIQGIVDGVINIDDSCLQVPNPFIAVSLTQHWFWINGFAPEALVTISIYDNQGDETPILEFSKPADPSGNLTIEGWQHTWDPEPGDYIVATDGLVTESLELAYVTLDLFDYDNDLISGKAMLGEKVDIGVGNADGEQWMTVYADEASADEGVGLWSADFKTIGFDITEDMWAGAHVNDEDGDVTAAHNSGPPEPPAWFTAFPEQDAIEGWDFPLGAVVHLAIDDPATNDSPDHEQDEVVTFTPWGSWQLWVWFDFADAYNMKAGDIVTLTYAGTVRTHIVRNLAISKVNPEDDLVKGVADPGADVIVRPYAIGEEQMVTANPKGKWNADLTAVYDLMRGDGVRAEVWDEMGNATAVDWYISNPRIAASITEDWFYLQEFGPNTILDFSIYEGQNQQSIWKGTATTDGSGFAWINAEGRWNFEPGNYLVVKDGENTKTLIIEGFTFDIFDPAKGQLIGTAPEPYGRRVWVGIGWENDSWSMDVATNDTGVWFADFQKPVPGDYSWVAAQIFDADGDASELRPAPQSMFLSP